jgi:predicted O-methyltransferase YrrM
MSLADCRPDLVPPEHELKEATVRLQVAYDDYVARVSPANMAMSLESAAYILWLAETTGAHTGADFGSGFTSYVLRLAGLTTTSVDDSPEWLHWTREFLRRYKLNSGELCEWETYRDRICAYDLVVYDFSSGPIRDANFQHAIGQLVPGGLAVLDDAQHEGHQISMIKAVRHYQYQLFDIQAWTRDQFRRYAALVVT